MKTIAILLSMVSLACVSDRQIAQELDSCKSTASATSGKCKDDCDCDCGYYCDQGTFVDPGSMTCTMVTDSKSSEVQNECGYAAGGPG